MNKKKRFSATLDSIILIHVCLFQLFQVFCYDQAQEVIDFFSASDPALKKENKDKNQFLILKAVFFL
jgi:hypothetical protein